MKCERSEKIAIKGRKLIGKCIIISFYSFSISASKGCLSTAEISWNCNLYPFSLQRILSSTSHGTAAAAGERRRGNPIRGEETGARAGRFEDENEGQCE